MHSQRSSHIRGLRQWGQRYHGALAGFTRSENGTAMVLVGFFIIILVGAAGLAFDSGRGYLVKARLGQAVDAAALAGGRSLTIGGGGDYEAQIAKYFVANFPDGFMGAEVSDPVITVNGDGDEISVAATATIPTTLMRVLNVQDVQVSASAVVNRTLKGLEVSLVLDNSGSMGRNGKMTDLKTSSKLLVDILYGDNETVDDLYVALVPFTARSNLLGSADVHPESPPVANRICLDPRAAPNDVDDASPTDAPFAHYSGPISPTSSRYRSRVCPSAPVLPLETQKTTVKTALDAMNAQGCTRYDVGTVWGWRTLSPRWRGFWQDASLPLDYGSALMDKAIIIMTDGINTPGSDCSQDPLTKAQTEAMFAAECTSMKDAGIIVYTITFQLDDSATNTLFRNCASGEARYFKSPSGEELETAFITIANDLSTLRLTK